MKIIGFLGSARVNGRCGKLLRRALEGAASKGAEVKRYDLIKCNIMYCRGCGKCFEHNPELTIGKCPLKDDMRSILEEYVHSDGYIFATPTHELFVTALMKTFLERKIVLTSEEDPAEMPMARPGVKANFMKMASFIVTANAPEELESVMGNPCYEAIEGGLMFEEVVTREKLFVGSMRTITDEAFSQKITTAYQLGINLVDAIEKVRKKTERKMNGKQRKVNLSKSKYLAGLQCLKRLYLQCYQPALAGEIDEQQQALFDQGTEVGLFAQKVFPSGVLLSEDHRHHREAVSRTRQLIGDRSIPSLFEAAFTFEDIYIRVDILERLPGNRWRMIEVKSSTGVKSYHLPDVAIQKYVLEQCGLTVSHPCLMHLNRDYVYDGKHYQYEQLFTIEDLKAEIEEIEQGLPEHLAQQWETLKGEHPPEIAPGLHCSDPFTCDFYEVCNTPFPEDWPGNLPRMGGKVEDLRELGITSIHHIPDDFPLSASQRRARDCFTRNEPYYDENLPAELNALDYPLYFMDFETLFPALPRYKGMRPYDHIPFQWSVHVQKTPGSEPEHYEFLHHDTTDPREPFITSLLSVLEKPGTAPILVYSSFESTRLKELSHRFPQYAERIAQVRERLWDLLPVIRNNVYHPRFMGSFSIKYVLPSLIPGMSYENMEVADGTAAGLAYERMTGGGLEPGERAKVRQSLLDYCRQDSLAMVRLLDHLFSVV